MKIKNQDIVLLAVLMRKDTATCTFARLAEIAALSVSESHGGVRRLQNAALVNAARQPVRGNVMEFLVHGLKYVCPLENLDQTVKGLPTAYAAPVAADEFAASGLIPVWPFPQGDACGRAFKPVYATAPTAAARDSDLYAKLALFDMLRGGRLRERRFAEQKLSEMMK